VSGTLSPEIAFEVSLPAKWNGRFYMIGNGGHAGESLEDPGRVAQKNQALQLGFAFAQTNTGHDARKEPGGSFVMSNPQKAIDYAWRAVHLTATTSKDITKDYYGKAASKSYWNSCSNGGRQGLIEAQRFPEDFDGIVANAPWVDQTGFSIGAMWNQKAITARASRRQAGDGGREGDEQVRRHRRAEGWPDRRPAQVRLQPGARRACLQRRRGRQRGLPDAGRPTRSPRCIAARSATASRSSPASCPAAKR
jgi:hypothetical protein